MAFTRQDSSPITREEIKVAKEEKAFRVRERELFSPAGMGVSIF